MVYLPREGGNVVVEALLVADEGIDAVPEGQGGAAVHRRGQTGQRHERDEAERLEGHGLAAGVAAADDQHAVAALDAQGTEIVDSLGGKTLHILEGEAALGHIVCDVDHCQFVGILPRQGIHCVKCKVIAVGIGIV